MHALSEWFVLQPLADEDVLARAKSPLSLLLYVFRRHDDAAHLG
jgi:hypothetical protein